jgi:putative two-component system response regulator
LDRSTGELDHPHLPLGERHGAGEQSRIISLLRHEPLHDPCGEFVDAGTRHCRRPHGIRSHAFPIRPRSIALRHHERWDGRGYPGGLSSSSIPLFARIVAVADVYDALSSHRSYKETWTRAKIVEFFEEQSGKHFDPELAQILLLNLPLAEAIRARRPD